MSELWDVYTIDRKLIGKTCIRGEQGKFKPAMGSQWVCYEEIVPDNVIEIYVDDYLDMCVVEENEEL